MASLDDENECLAFEWLFEESPALDSNVVVVAVAGDEDEDGR